MPDPGVRQEKPSSAAAGASEKGGYLAKATGRGPSLPAPPPENLGKAPTYNIEAVQKHVQDLRQAYQQAGSVLPPQVMRDESGRVMEGWSPTMALNPSGDPLPWGAYAWDDRGEPVFGKKGETGLIGDVVAYTNKIWSDMTGGTGVLGGIGARRESQYAAADAILNTPVETETITGPNGKPVEVLKGSLLERDIRNVMSWYKRGTAAGGVLGGVSQILTVIPNAILPLFNAPINALGRGAGTQLLALQDLGQGAKYLPAVPENIRRMIVAGKTDNPTGIKALDTAATTARTILGLPLAAPVEVYMVWRAAEAFVEGKWKPSDVPPALEKNWQASRIFATVWVYEARRQEFLRQLQDGADPRVLAAKLEDPGVEMTWQVFHDPTIVWGLFKGSAVTAKALAGAENRVVDTAVADVLKRAPEMSPEEFARAANVAVDSLYRRAEVGITEAATTRGATTLTAEGKRFVATQDGQRFIGTIASHFENDQAGMLEAIEASARLASPNQAERMLGLETAARLRRQAGLPTELFLSDEGAAQGVAIRNMIVDAEGKINPSATILKDIEEAAGDSVKLTELATRRVESAYERMYPTVEQQLKQGEEYAALLAKDPEKAALYLARNPAAATEVPEFTRRLSSFYNSLPKPVMNVMHSVQAAMYMILSPGYAARNHLQNAVHIFVDRGPAEAWKAFTFGGKSATEELTKALGFNATALTAGFGKPGAEASWKLGGLALSANMEQNAAAVVVNGAVQEALDNAAAHLPIDDLARTLSEDQGRLWRYYISTEKDIQRGTARFLEAQGSNVRTLADLNADQITILKAHRGDRTAQMILDTAASEDDIAAGIQAMKNEWDDLARREASGITIPNMDGATAEQQAILARALADIPPEASQEAGILSKQINAGRAYFRDSAAAANEYYDFALGERIKVLAAETQPGVDATVAMAAKGPEAAGARNLANVVDQARGEIGKVRQNFQPKLDNMIDEAFRQSDAFRGQAWGWSDLSRDLGRQGDVGGLRALWQQAKIPQEFPEILAENPGKLGSVFREMLWQGEGPTPSAYRLGQKNVWASAREAIALGRQAEMESLAKLVGISEADIATNYGDRAAASLQRARLWDTADLSGIEGLTSSTLPGRARADVEAFAAGAGSPEMQANARKIVRQRLKELEAEHASLTRKLDELAASGASTEELNGVRRQIGEIDRIMNADTVRLPPVPEGHVRVYRAEPPGEPSVSARFWSEDRQFATENFGGGSKNPKVYYRDIPRDQWDAAKLAAEEQRGIVPNAPEVPEELRGLEGYLPPEAGGVPGEQISGFTAAERKAATERNVAQRIIEEENARGAQLDLLIPPQGDEPLTASRMAAETRDGYKNFLDELQPDLVRAFNGRQVGKLTSEQLAEVNRALPDMRAYWTQARSTAFNYAKGVRKFTLLSYPERYGGDLIAGTLFPYHFWYSRTYMNWIKRAAQNPFLLSAYADYRNYIEKVHAGMPDWWKWNLNSNELLGLNSKNPLYFNLEATMSPLYGIVGVDFNDPYKRVDAVSKTLDDLSKFGPGIWTGYSLALATSYLIQGKDDAAARWGGRLTTATRTFRDITALLGLNKGKGIEIDPLVQLYSGGLTPYDRNRVGTAFDQMMASGQYGAADIEQAAYEQNGPIWDQAVATVTQQRAPGEIGSWLFGTGFKPRTQTDMQLDQMWADRRMIQSQMPNMSPEQRRSAWDELRARYPFMDAVMLARKGGVERDSAYTYLVLGRIPPGMQDDFAEAVGIDYKLVSRFYDDPGALDNMALTDRNRFMAGIADIGAMLDVPSEATRAEWSEAKNRYGKIRASIENAWGKDIFDKIDVYYGKLGDDQKSRDAAQAYLDAHPEVSEAMDAQTASAMSDPLVGAYYSSLQKIERYWKGRMYDDIEQRLGADVWDKWNEYDDAKLEGTGKEYWKAHPELQQYLDIRDSWEPIVASQTADFALKLPERESFRLRAEPQSLGQEAIANMQQQEAYRLTRQEWEQAMGPLLTNLVQDYIVNDEALPSAATKRLTDVATNLGLPDNPMLVVELYERSALQPAGLTGP